MQPAHTTHNHSRSIQKVYRLYRPCLECLATQASSKVESTCSELACIQTSPISLKNKQENGCNIHQYDLASHLISMQSFIDLTRKSENCCFSKLIKLFRSFYWAACGRASFSGNSHPREGFSPGGYFRNFWLGVCRVDPGTLAYTRASSAEIC